MKKISLVLILSFVPNTIDDSSFSHQQYAQPQGKIPRIMGIKPYLPPKCLENRSDYSPSALVISDKISAENIPSLPLEHPASFKFPEKNYSPSLLLKKETSLEKREEERIWYNIILPGLEKVLPLLEEESSS